MELALLGAAAVVLIVVAAGFGRKFGIATPLVLVALGAGLSFAPGAPHIPLEPEWILVVVLPPLLYSAAVNVNLHDFRRNATPILGLGVVAVVISAFACATVLYVLLPSLDFAAALALGAVIAPTDAVAATSIAKRVGLPHRLVTVLEGESLINDASALTLLRTAIAAIGGSVSLLGTLGGFAWAVVGGGAVGLALGLLSVYIRSRFTDEMLATTLSFVVPFLAYVGAEELHASGVISVVVAGLLIGHESAKRFSARSRLTERLNWRTVQFVLENGVFLLMGYQLQTYWSAAAADGVPRWKPLLLALLVVAVLLVVRMGFVAPLIGWLRHRDRSRIDRGEEIATRIEEVRTRFREEPSSRVTPKRLHQFDLRARQFAADLEFLRREGLGWRGGAVIAWAGMRGVVTVAAAQSLPLDTPDRGMLILIAFVVAVVTLGLGGLTLPPLIRALGLRDTDAEEADAERRELIEEIRYVTSLALRNPKLTWNDGQSCDADLVEKVLAEQAAFGNFVLDEIGHSDPRAEQLHLLRTVALETKRAALLDARSSGTYSTSAVNAVETILDNLELRVDGRNLSTGN